jgi:hypothetical protein
MTKWRFLRSSAARALRLQSSSVIAASYACCRLPPVTSRLPRVCWRRISWTCSSPTTWTDPPEN